MDSPLPFRLSLRHTTIHIPPINNTAYPPTPLGLAGPPNDFLWMGGGADPLVRMGTGGERGAGASEGCWTWRGRQTTRFSNIDLRTVAEYTSTQRFPLPAHPRPILHAPRHATTDATAQEDFQARRANDRHLSRTGGRNAKGCGRVDACDAVLERGVGAG